MKSPRRHHRPKRSSWDHCNTPDALRRRRARADARREELAASLPPIDPGPQPLESWQTVQVLDASGRVALRIDLVVPTWGRCDQHAAMIDGAQADRLLTATEVGRLVAAAIVKRPSRDMLAEERGWHLIAEDSRA
jgi:hypothetical protein